MELEAGERVGSAAESATEAISSGVASVPGYARLVAEAASEVAGVVRDEAGQAAGALREGAESELSRRRAAAEAEMSRRRNEAEAELARRRVEAEAAARALRERNIPGLSAIAVELTLGSLRLARTIATAPLRLALAFLRPHEA